MKLHSEGFRRSIQSGFITFMVMQFLWPIFGHFLPAGVVNFCRQFGFDPGQPQVAAIFVSMIVAIGVYARESIRQASLTSDMGLQDFEHRQDVQRSDLGEWADLEVFNNWHKAENGFEGRFLEEHVKMVDLTTVAESEEGSTFTAKTVFLLNDTTGRVPDFDLHNRTCLSKLIVALFGGNDVMPKERLLIPTGVSRESRHLVEKFNHYYFRPVASDEVTGRLLSAETLACLARNPGWSVECKHGRMALWHKRRLVSAETRLEALKQAVEIKQVILASVQKTAMEQSSRTRHSPLFQIHEINAGGGGPLGFFGGFILGGSVAMFLFVIVALRMPLIMQDYFMPFWLILLGIVLSGLYYGINSPRRWRIARLYKSQLKSAEAHSE